MKELKEEATSRENGTEEAKGGGFYYQPLYTVDIETICMHYFDQCDKTEINLKWVQLKIAMQWD